MLVYDNYSVTQSVFLYNMITQLSHQWRFVPSHFRHRSLHSAAG